MKRRRLFQKFFCPVRSWRLVAILTKCNDALSRKRALSASQLKPFSEQAPKTLPRTKKARKKAINTRKSKTVWYSVRISLLFVERRKKKTGKVKIFIHVNSFSFKFNSIANNFHVELYIIFKYKFLSLHGRKKTLFLVRFPFLFENL